MNRNRYVTRPLDTTDRAIMATLNENGRMAVRELAKQIGISSPSVTERIHMLEDTCAIRCYTIIVDPTAFGLGISAHVRVCAMPDEIRRVEQMLIEGPEIVEADHVTGEDCFPEKVIVSDLHELETDH